MGNQLPKNEKVAETPLKTLRLNYPGGHLTQEAISKKIGCNIKAYRAWEKGQNDPDTYYLRQLASFFHVSTDYILGISPYRRVGYEDINAITGLSENAVDFLDFMQRDNGGSLFCKEVLEVINLLLEKGNTDYWHRLYAYIWTTSNAVGNKDIGILTHAGVVNVHAVDVLNAILVQNTVFIEQLRKEKERLLISKQK